MTAQPLPKSDIDHSILLQAADWLVLLQSGDATERDRAALSQWIANSPAHQAAWQRAQHILDAFGVVPSKLGRDTLSRLDTANRRQMLRLGLMLLAMPTAGWLAWRQAPWQQWSADMRTATGERQTLTLADGTQLVLNTASAVDLVFTAVERRLFLQAGEILITTGTDPSPAPRPFLVATDNGSMRALGTRFTVRRTDDDSTHVAVFEGAVEVRPVASSQAAIVNAGEQLRFTPNALQSVQPADATATLWENGMLLARDMRLDTLLAELGRYRRGMLRCDQAVAGLTVSGAFPLDDTDASLALLEATLPVRVGRASPWWVTVQAR